MQPEQDEADRGLYAALSSDPGVAGSGWELLFDKEKLISTQVDELPDVVATFEHPLLDFYAEYGRRIWGRPRSVFIPPEAAILVNAHPRVIEVFEQCRARLPTFWVIGAREKYKLDPKAQRVGVLTAGGNAPGLNTVIDSLVKRHALLATRAGARQGPAGPVQGLEIYGYLGGYNGLIAGNKKDLDPRLTDRASLAAGSLLQIRRGEKPTDEGARDKLIKKMADAVGRDQLDILYVIGGNGTIKTAASLCEQLAGVKGLHGLPVRVLAAPKTMDNDVNFTDVTFGFRTTVENTVELLRRIHLEAETGGRLGIVELFGAGSGFVALHAAYASGDADYVLIPEAMTGSDENRLAEIKRAVKRLKERYEKRGHALLVVAEGATARVPWALLERESKTVGFDALAAYITGAVKHGLGVASLEVVISAPKHLIRSTPPGSSDVDLCKQTGKLLVDAALAGLSNAVVALWHGEFVAVPMGLAVAELKRVDVGSYYFLSMMEKYLID
jgi:6-phosphofructokinase 1